MTELFKPEFEIRPSAPLTGTAVPGPTMRPLGNFSRILLLCTYTADAMAAPNGQARLIASWQSVAADDYQALDTSGTLLVDQFRDLPAVAAAGTARRAVRVDNPGGNVLVVSALEVGDAANPGVLEILATAIE